MPWNRFRPTRTSASRSFRPGLERLEDRLAPATLPLGFSETPIAQGLNRPTAAEVAPDGRIFVAEQGGTLRVISAGQLLPTPFVSLPVNDLGERGLLGVTLDPDFASNQFVYVYYTVPSPLHNRVSRFTANGNVAMPGSEVALLDLEPLAAANHNGGAIHFGLDGNLYVAVGENGVGSNSQSLNTRLGKMLRINRDGTIPSDNPFFTVAAGDNRAIWALGLRNPFTFAVQPGTGRIFINDVGQNSFEEINDGIAGSNYGWPQAEGFSTNPAFRNPLFAYPYGGGASGTDIGVAITGGTFYDPATVQFPADFVGDYLFADLGNGWIRRYDPANGSVTLFGSDLPGGLVDLDVDASGSLLYLAGAGTSNGQLVRITSNLGQEQKFVSHLYADLLGRPGAPPEWDFWVGQIPSLGRAGVASAIRHAPEGLILQVQGYYQHVLGRDVDPAGQTFWVNILQGGANAEGVLAGLLASPEFAGRANALEGSADPDANYVRALYDVVLGRTASANEVGFWIGTLSSLGRTGVAAGFLSSSEFRNRVAGSFYGPPLAQPLPFLPSLLKRETPPAAGEIQFWVDTGLDVLAMEAAFAGSEEYFVQS